jgi:hypothetical protein
MRKAERPFVRTAMKTGAGWREIQVMRRPIAAKVSTEPATGSPVDNEPASVGSVLLPIAAEVHRVVTSARRFPKEWYEVG